MLLLFVALMKLQTAQTFQSTANELTGIRSLAEQLANWQTSITDEYDIS